MAAASTWEARPVLQLFVNWNDIFRMSPAMSLTESILPASTRASASFKSTKLIKAAPVQFPCSGSLSTCNPAPLVKCLSVPHLAHPAPQLQSPHLVFRLFSCHLFLLISKDIQAVSGNKVVEKMVGSVKARQLTSLNSLRDQSRATFLHSNRQT